MYPRCKAVIKVKLKGEKSSIAEPFSLYKGSFTPLHIASFRHIVFDFCCWDIFGFRWRGIQ